MSEPSESGVGDDNRTAVSDEDAELAFRRWHAEVRSTTRWNVHEAFVTAFAAARRDVPGGREARLEEALKYIALPTMGYNDTSVAPEVFAQENATEANARLALATCIRQARSALGWGPIGWGPASQDAGTER